MQQGAGTRHPIESEGRCGLATSNQDLIHADDTLCKGHVSGRYLFRQFRDW